MDSAKRTRLSPQERRAQFIELGVRMLSLQNLDAISVEEIADQAGVSRGLLYNYFASKNDFHIAIVEHASAEMLTKTDPEIVANGTNDPLEILGAVLESYVDYVSNNSKGYLSLLRGSANGDPHMREIFERNRAAMASRIVSKMPLLGIEPSPKIELVARGWIAFVEEVTVTWLRRRQDAERDDAADQTPSDQTHSDETISKEQLIQMHVQALPALALAASPDLGALLTSALTGPAS